MRRVITKDGMLFKGRNVDFFDRGDHIVCRSGRYDEKIYKINIYSDQESNGGEVGFLVFLMLMIFGVFIFIMIVGAA